MNNVKKIFFGLAALAIVCFFTAPVVWAGDVSVDSMDGQWFKLKVKSTGYTTVYDASGDVYNITGKKKKFANKKVYMYLEWVDSAYFGYAYTRDASSDWIESELGPMGPASIHPTKKYIIQPLEFEGINKDRAELPLIAPEAYIKFNVKTDKEDDFKSAKVKSVGGMVEFEDGIWSDDPEENFMGNCTITGKSVKEANVPDDIIEK